MEKKNILRQGDLCKHYNIYGFDVLITLSREITFMVAIEGVSFLLRVQQET